MLSGQQFAVVGQLKCMVLETHTILFSFSFLATLPRLLMRLSQLEARIEAATVRAIITAIIFNVCDPFCHSCRLAVLHVSCFSILAPTRALTHTFTFYDPDIGKSPTRPVPKLLFPRLDPSQQFFPPSGNSFSIFLFVVVTRNKNIQAFRFHFLFGVFVTFSRPGVFPVTFPVLFLLFFQTSKSVSRLI